MGLASQSPEGDSSDRGFNNLARWFDSDGDGDQDLLHWTRSGVALYRNLGHRFERESITTTATRFLGNIAIADFDQDGDTDVFLAAWDGNRLLRNDDGSFVVESPQASGLPGRSLCSAWVDYDNDGSIDLFSVPGGLFLGGREHRFAADAAGSLQVDPRTQCALAPIAGFLDVDNDGDRDLLYSRLLVESSLIPDLEKHVEYFDAAYSQRLDAGDPPFRFIWTWDVVMNRRAAGHWIAIDLAGDGSNRQAIGASVKIGRQLLQVGESDTSRCSQGHYRLYKGLGGDDRPVDVQIRWPDGSIETRAGEKVDRLIVIEKTPARESKKNLGQQTSSSSPQGGIPRS